MQRARQGRAAVADPRPGQAAPRGERGGGGCGSRPRFVVGEQRVGRAASGERALRPSGARGSGLGVPGSAAAGTAERPPGCVWEPACLRRLRSALPNLCGD